MHNLDQAKAASSIFHEVVNEEIIDATVELQKAKDELAKLQAELDGVPLPGPRTSSSLCTRTVHPRTW